jgi:hypothetical protein
MTDLPERDDFGDYGRWPGRAVLDPSGHRLGEVREIYLDDATDRPEWVLVDRDDDGPRFVPLADATVADDSIKVAQASDRVGAAPSLEPSKELSQDEERRLYDHYGLRYSEDASDSLLPDAHQPSPTAEPEVAGTTGDAAPAETAPPEPAAEEPEPQPETAPPSAADAAPLPAASASAAARPKLRRYVGAGPALPPPGETSEPEDRGPMVPPRAEPVAPPRLEPEPGGALAVVRRNPVPVAAGAAALLGALLIILLRRR